MSVSSGMAGIETFGTMETPFHLSIKTNHQFRSERVDELSDVTCLPAILSPFDWYRVQTPKIPALPLGLHTFPELLELPTAGMLPA